MTNTATYQIVYGGFGLNIWAAIVLLGIVCAVGYLLVFPKEKMKNASQIKALPFRLNN